MTVTGLTESAAQPRGRLWHAALFYGSEAEYVDGVLSFLRDGLVAEEPVLVAVPHRHLDLLRGTLDGSAERIDFADMTELGRNPGRIIPAVRRFIDTHAGRRVRFVGEPIWPGRTAAETAEATRHEALINLAFADSTAHILCPYDLRHLDPTVIADSHRTHPHLIEGGHRRPSARFADPLLVCEDEAWPLPAPPAHAHTLEFDVGRLAAVRRLVQDRAGAVGLTEERAHELVVAVNEIATNTLLHGAGTGRLRVWQEPRSVVCEVSGHGHIADPLAGRHLPSPDSSGGRGLWLTHQLCDLVEVRSHPRFTTIRLRVDS